MSDKAQRAVGGLEAFLIYALQEIGVEPRKGSQTKQELMRAKFYNRGRMVRR